MQGSGRIVICDAAHPYGSELVVVRWEKEPYTTPNKKHAAFALPQPNLCFRSFVNDFDSALAGLLYRVLFPVVDGKAVVTALRPEFRSAEIAETPFMKLMTQYRNRLANRVGWVYPMDDEEFVRTSPPHKKKLYARCIPSLNHTDWDEEDTIIRAFVKEEKHELTGKGSTVPRLIQGRLGYRKLPRYHFRLGQHLRPMEHKIYEAMEHGTRLSGSIVEVFVAKGRDAAEVARGIVHGWGLFKRPVAVGLDASKFDAFVSQMLLSFEHELYLKCSPAGLRDELRALLEHQFVNVGKIRARGGKIRYLMKGRRCSGDINTGLGNTVLMVSILRAFCATVGLHAYIVDNGDDAIIICEQSDLYKMEGLTGVVERETGLKIVAEEPVLWLEQIEFCRSHPVSTDHGWVMVRNQDAVGKDLVCIKHDMPKVWLKKWLYCVGEGGLAASRGVPVRQSFYNMLKRMGTKGRVKPDASTEYTFKWVKTDPGEVVITGAARYSYWLAFGVTPEEQLAWEGIYNDVEEYGEEPPTIPLMRGSGPTNFPLWPVGVDKVGEFSRPLPPFVVAGFGDGAFAMEAPTGFMLHSEELVATGLVQGRFNRGGRVKVDRNQNGLPYQGAGGYFPSWHMCY